MQGKYTLDKKDKRILAALDLNARIPITKIAKMVRLSREVVAYRIKRLEDKGIIEGYYAVLDVSKLGYMYCRVFIRYLKMSPEEEEELIDYGKQKKNIGWVALSDGRWDLAFVYWIKNYYDFEKDYDELLFKFGKHFKEKNVSIAFRIYHFPLTAIHEGERVKPLILGKAGKKTDFDDIDVKIITMLSKNGRMGCYEMGEKLNMSANSIKYRLKNLIDKKIILGFKTKINNNKLGFEHHKVFLMLENLSKEKYNKLISYLSMNKNVIYITKATGISELEFEALVRSKIELYNLLIDLRSKFSDILRDYESIIHFGEPLINYLPIEVSQ